MGQVDGGRILLTVVAGPPAEPPDDSSGVRALLDTGATISCVTPPLVERLALESDGEWIRLAGIHGPREAPTYRMFLGIPIADHHGAPAFIRGDTSLRVAKADIPDSAGFEVLLGMDFLHPFHFTVYRDVFILSN